MIQARIISVGVALLSMPLTFGVRGCAPRSAGHALGTLPQLGDGSVWSKAVGFPSRATSRATCRGTLLAGSPAAVG
eukprot:7669062-Alexandrium_andersonii.AAC.1